MKAVIQMTELKQQWSPPFKKSFEVKELSLKEGESFGEDGVGKPIFKLKKVEMEKVLVGYHRDFAVKGYVQPDTREVWVERGEERSFSALWNDNGETKTLCLLRTE